MQAGQGYLKEESPVALEVIKELRVQEEVHKTLAHSHTHNSIRSQPPVYQSTFPAKTPTAGGVANSGERGAWKPPWSWVQIPSASPAKL